MKVLLTAFDPFGGESVNPAQEALALLPERVKGAELIKLVVPTAFAWAAKTAVSAIKEHRPDAVMMLGQAGGRSGITVERVAINVMDAGIMDNEGKMPLDEPIRKGGPAAYFATLPVKELVLAVRDAGVPASISNSAGTFVCNSLLYGVLDYLKTASLPCKAGFIHLPFLPEQAKRFSPHPPSLPLDRMVKGLTAALAALSGEN